MDRGYGTDWGGWGTDVAGFGGDWDQHRVSLEDFERRSKSSKAPATHEISKAFGDLNIKLTPAVCRQIIELVSHYEVKRDNPLTLNSRLLGVHRMYFYPEDRAAIYAIFHLEEKQISRMIKSIPTIDKKRKVISDPFNVFCTWLIHLAMVQINQKQLQHDTQLAIAKYLSYKLFTSLVLQRFRYLANENTMMSTIMSLNKKFDIIREGSWKNSITARMNDLISPRSPHYETFIEPDDENFLKIIADVQTRLRAKINLIASAFYDEHKQGNSLQSMSSTYTDRDGEQFLVQRENTVSSAQYRLANDLRNINAWMDFRSVQAVATRFPQISPTLFKNALQLQSNEAMIQSKTPGLPETGMVNGREIIYDQRKLIAMIVETSTRNCVRKGILFRDKHQAWTAILNLYSSSRTLDPDVVKVKSSMEYFIDQTNIVQREATKSSLRLAMIMYVIFRMLRSF